MYLIIRALRLLALKKSTAVAIRFAVAGALYQKDCSSSLVRGFLIMNRVS